MHSQHVSGGLFTPQTVKLVGTEDFFNITESSSTSVTALRAAIIHIKHNLCKHFLLFRMGPLFPAICIKQPLILIQRLLRHTFRRSTSWNRKTPTELNC